MNNRPSFHYTPNKGWINDPNGTIYIDGKYHLFCQYYPDDTVWGPMHWGHAISSDLINWEEQDIAIYPDSLGYIFSGSCILDTDNLSGLGSRENPALLAFYTSHNPDNGEQQQSLSYSLDYKHFKSYEANPIIKNKLSDSDYKIDFRDPKVFKNPYLGGYSMILTAGRIMEFYHSNNLLNWKKTGEFDPSVNGFAGIVECPDCIQMDDDNWIVTLSIILNEDKIGTSLKDKEYINQRVMQYFIGRFDGYCFTDSLKNDEPLILDYGTDNYSLVSFANLDAKIFIGWGENWDYVRDLPCKEYKGKMTLARSASLIDTPYGKRLSFKPILDLENKAYMDNIQKITVANNTTVTFDNFKISVNKDSIYLHRNTETFPIKIDPNKYHNMFAKRTLSSDTATFTIIKDANYYEIFADEGTIVFSVNS